MSILSIEIVRIHTVSNVEKKEEMMSSIIMKNNLLLVDDLIFLLHICIHISSMSFYLPYHDNGSAICVVVECFLIFLHQSSNHILGKPKKKKKKRSMLEN